MDNNDLFELMKVNGFTGRQIKRVFDHSVKMGVTLKFMLAELSERFLKVLRMHISVNVIIISMFLLNYKASEPYEPLSLIVPYVVAMVLCERFAPIIFSYKAYNLRGKLIHNFMGF